MTIALPRANAAGCIASVRPLVVLSKRDTPLALGLASHTPGHFEGRRSLHFVGLSWSCEDRSNVEALARDLDDARRTLPEAYFVIMANTPFESAQLSKAGIVNILANELIFVDEREFTPPLPAERHARLYDAVYVARLRPMKRHELARSVDKLLLMYGRPETADIENVKSQLPRATFANHEFNAGAYRHLSHETVRDLLRQSSVGLCLSAVEGAMRASIEYRLCGLPVVSTRSTGGRDRYLLGPHVRVVADRPDAVVAAVRELKTHQFDPFAVREYVGQLIAFDRHNFLLNANKIVERTFGVRDHFRNFAPFIRLPVLWRPAAEIFAPLHR